MWWKGFLLTKARFALDLSQHFGPGWLAFRAQYAAKQRLGWAERKSPVSSWGEPAFTDFLKSNAPLQADAYLAYRRQNAPDFFFSAETQPEYTSLFSAWDHGENNPVAQAKALAQGQWPFFSQQQAANGFPPDWQRNPFTETSPFPLVHWSRLHEFGAGDIKLIWETSRFGFVYTLVRAYWRTGDTQYAEWFWQLVLDWIAHNPPNQGVNWKCGQETSLRVMACCFGLYGFLHSAATTAERVWSMAELLAVSGERIEANLAFALSQRNNHGISEGMGLWTLGMLFPELKAASRWEAKGRQVLETQAQPLIYDDGSFAQHSVNYHRLMLHDYLWCVRLAEIGGHSFSPELKQRIGKAGNWLYQLQVGQQGEVPQYGQLDGALILPLNNCGFQDYRPVIQATHYLTTGERCYADGPWDEDLLWLFGPEALESPVNPPKQADFSARDGGYYTLRTAESMVFTRCGVFKDRPGQADILHMDVWYGGYPVALDAGTYSYNAPPPWNNSLAETQYHNCVTVDGLAQMKRAGTFLWLPWLQGKVEEHRQADDGALAYWQGSHNGYERLSASVRVRRGIARFGRSSWLVVDDLHSREAHDYRLHWLLADWPYSWQEAEKHVVLQTPAGEYHVYMGVVGEETAVSSLVRADVHSPRGWQAPTYYSRSPALSIDLTMTASHVRFWTWLAPMETAVMIDDQKMEMKTAESTATVIWASKQSDRLLQQLTLQEKELSHLDIIL